MANVEVLIRRNSDRATMLHKCESSLSPMERPEDMETLLYQWTDGGNDSCDCTLHEKFEEARGNLIPCNIPCGMEAYAIAALRVDGNLVFEEESEATSGRP